jgi:hypothetical protein
MPSFRGIGFERLARVQAVCLANRGRPAGPREISDTAGADAVTIEGAVRTGTLALAAVLTGASAGAAEGFLHCNSSHAYDGCECHGYQRGRDQVVTPSTHPTRAAVCNLINLQTAFDYAVDAQGQGLSVVLLRGERYPLSPPVYELAGQEVTATINDGIVRAHANGQTWTSHGDGPYPVVSLAPFRGYEEYSPTGCTQVPPDDPDSDRLTGNPDARLLPGCDRHPKHQMQIFDAEGHRVTIDHLELDGGLDASCSQRPPPVAGWRRRFHRPALVELGWSALASGTAFHDNVVRNAAGWTSLHLGEGPLDAQGVPACRDVAVHGNTFSDLGQNLCDSRGGAFRQCYWSDAVSMACQGSVRNNTIRNPTDVGVVAFVGGVAIEDNEIVADRGKAFGGIAAVDELQTADGRWVANHDGTVIAGNTVRAEGGGAFDVGIAIGQWAWRCALHAQPTFADSLVVGNRLDGGEGRINYGLAVTLADGVEKEGFRVGSEKTCSASRCFEDFLPNTFRGSFGRGTPGAGCSGEPAGPPFSYVVNSCTNCWLQDGFVRAADYFSLLGGIAASAPPMCTAP